MWLVKTEAEAQGNQRQYFFSKKYLSFMLGSCEFDCNHRSRVFLKQWYLLVFRCSTANSETESDCDGGRERREGDGKRDRERNR